MFALPQRQIANKLYAVLLLVKHIEMDKAIEHQLKIKRVREMKNPTILMNDKDLEAFIKEVEAKVNNFKVGEHPTYSGIPIVEAKHIEQGTFIIYDNIVDKLFN